MLTTALTVLDRFLLANSMTAWMIACSIAALIMAVTLLLRVLIRRHYARLAQTETVEFAEIPLQIAARTTTLFLCVISAYVGSNWLEMPPRVDRGIQLVTIIAIFWQLGVWLSAAAQAWIEMKRRRSLETDKAAIGSLSIIGVVLRLLIWSVVLLLTLDNLGINITTLVAGLGIGGIAVALAVQNVLGDLLASLSITLDKPFVIGDFLIVGDYLGSVEYIGIKSTRLRSLSGEQIIMANADLLSSRLRNYGRMQERRIVFAVGVTYETPHALLQEIPRIIRELVCAQTHVRFDRCHLAQFGSYAIEFECVYYVLSSDYGQYMDIQQAINLQLHAAFEQRGIEFAYPTQKLFISQAQGAAAHS